jgi:hypothetical protein
MDLKVYVTLLCSLCWTYDFTYSRSCRPRARLKGGFVYDRALCLGWLQLVLETLCSKILPFTLYLTFP